MNLLSFLALGLALGLAQLATTRSELCEPQAARHEQDNARCPGTVSDEMHVKCKSEELERIRKCIEPEFKRLLPCAYLEMKIFSYRRQCLKLKPRFAVWMLKVFVYLGNDVRDFVHVQVLQTNQNYELLRMTNNNHEDLFLPYDIEDDIQACPL